MNVLSHLINNAAAADDIMIFAEGTKRSVEGVISVFDDFAKYSGLKISLEKSTLYIAGIDQTTQDTIKTSFPFESGQLPVRYLGLPLMTKAMTKTDWLPLTEKLRKRISSWTTRFLSYAGRLQLIRSVLMSVTNFWSSTFRLPGSCIKEIGSICSAFLWSGPDLNSHKAKVAWINVCLPKSEGGLGLQSLKETNRVCGLKLIWRMLAVPTSLWSKWIHTNLLGAKSFWEIKSQNYSGSWIWRKILKLREQAKGFHKIDIKSGNGTSFWHDNWSSMGNLWNLLGDRGRLDLGIKNEATVEEVLNTHRSRRHRQDFLNKIESEIELLRQKRKEGELDTNQWRWKSGFKSKFSSSETLKMIRIHHPKCSWAKGVWFSQATPKYAFITWLAMQNKLSTGDRMSKWNNRSVTSCILCQTPMETRNHLFFQCPYAAQIWKSTAIGLLRNHYTMEWNRLTSMLVSSSLEPKALLLFRYAFQITIHTIWNERNSRRHDGKPVPPTLLGRIIDKTIRNRITLLRKSDNAKYEDLFILWLSTRL